MKRSIFLSAIMSLALSVVSAQTNQYPGTTGTISRTGYTYKYRTPTIAGVAATDWLELYNSVNTYLDVERSHQDGTPLSFDEVMGHDRTPVFSNASQTVDQTLAMIDGLFTDQQKAALSGKSLIITCKFIPATGNIADVYFQFFRDEPFMNIPVETYRSVELALKQNLTLTIVANGRRYNYIQLYWSQDF